MLGQDALYALAVASAHGQQLADVSELVLFSTSFQVEVQQQTFFHWNNNVCEGEYE